MSFLAIFIQKWTLKCTDNSFWNQLGPFYYRDMPWDVSNNSGKFWSARVLKDTSAHRYFALMQVHYINTYFKTVLKELKWKARTIEAMKCTGAAVKLKQYYSFVKCILNVGCVALLSRLVVARKTVKAVASLQTLHKCNTNGLSRVWARSLAPAVFAFQNLFRSLSVPKVCYSYSLPC